MAMDAATMSGDTDVGARTLTGGGAETAAIPERPPLHDHAPYPMAHYHKDIRPRMGRTGDDGGAGRGGGRTSGGSTARSRSPAARPIRRRGAIASRERSANTQREDDAMRCLLRSALAFSALAVPAGGGEEVAHNQLSTVEAEQGWLLLFDGTTTSGWHGFQKSGFPGQGWIVEDHCLKCLGTKGGDLVSDRAFKDFELAWEWRMSPKGNSGVKYLVDEKRADAKGRVYGSAIAHEYQMIDDEGLPAKQRTGSWYDVIAPQGAQPSPIGEFNRSRIVLRGRHVEHWLNGTQVVTYEIGSPEAAAAIAASKFAAVPGYGDKIEAPILLQDHDGVVWFRDIRIRPLPPP
jgi:hypothetical protein